jgi:hypothetical protein
MNTRKYTRTTLEAFGVDCRTACAIELPQRHDHVACVLLAIVIGVFAACVAVSWAVEPEITVIEKPCGDNGIEIDGKCFTKHGKVAK